MEGRTVTIPPHIVRFLEERANTAFAGTRDANLAPRGYRVSGWRVGADGCTLTALIPESSAPELLEALLDNGRLAMTVEEIGTHETYQLKGRYRRHRPAEPAEIELTSRIRDRFERGVRSKYLQEGLAERLGASIAAPGVAVDIEVHEIFQQTPGPGAGTRLAPPPEMEARAR